MDFCSNLADSIPGVGHVKAIIHYATGDTEGGNKAMYQATRTAVVLGAGATAGPGGAALAAMYGGAITDGVASVAMRKPQGLLKGCTNIVKDLNEGKNPTGAIGSTGLQVVLDGVSGIGMSVVPSAASLVSKKAVAKGAENIAMTAFKTTHVFARADVITQEEAREKRDREETERRDRERREREERKRCEREERERREREERERREREEERREREERERREREERERREREERERREREEGERHAREERERLAREERQQQERRAREQQEQRAREQQEQRAREQQEQRAREQQEHRAREQQEQRAREQQEQRAREQQEQRAREQLQQRVREQVKQCSTPNSNSGSSQPPQENEDNNDHSKKNKPDYFAIFKNLLEEILNVIFGVERPYTRNRISQIFQKLSKAQKNYLAKIIERLYKSGNLVEVLILVIRIFSEHFPEDISFTNFLSLIEFVAVYIQEEIDYRTEVFRMGEEISRENDSSIPKEETENLKAAIVSSIMNLADIVSRIVDVFVRLRFDIESELMPFEISEILLITRDLSSNFRDVFSAIYHYFKHRCVPKHVLSIREYYDWIRRVLEELGRHQDYRNLLQDRRTEVVRANVRFEMYVPIFDRRIRIVVKIHRESESLKIVLASCYILDNKNDGDGEGMVWIYIRRL
ncbi:unnamed protein product, partial [Brenthis ino]